VSKRFQAHRIDDRPDLLSRYDWAAVALAAVVVVFVAWAILVLVA
jgi:hypothetical protein